MRNITRRGAVSLLAIAALSVPITGCSSSPAPEAPADPSGSEADAQAQAESTAPAEPQPDPAQEPAATAEPEPEPSGSKVLVAYYSATGNTAAVGQIIAETLDADTFVMEPTQPYSDADLNWRDESSRVNDEHNDESLRDIPLLVATPPNFSNYDVIYLGYPIWWGGAAWPVNDFVKSNNFSGKTVVPFCTSSSSGIGDSALLLADMAGTGEWLEGQRFASGASASAVEAWVHDLGIE